MRSHPLLLKLGTGATPSVRKLDDVQMLELDDGFSRVQKEFGADLYKAADWRWDAPLSLPWQQSPYNYWYTAQSRFQCLPEVSKLM